MERQILACPRTFLKAEKWQLYPADTKGAVREIKNVSQRRAASLCNRPGLMAKRSVVDSWFRCENLHRPHGVLTTKNVEM